MSLDQEICYRLIVCSHHYTDLITMGDLLHKACSDNSFCHKRNSDKLAHKFVGKTVDLECGLKNIVMTFLV